jgi:hypothetical protein
MNASFQIPSVTGLGISLTEKIDEWLRQPEIGLRFDPFRERDAGSDPRLPLYLVDHGAFTTLWGDWPSFIFAPAGGGKTAFRVRLTHACRAGEDRRRIFPIVLATLDPTVPFFESLTQGAASELLLHLLYFPPRFLALDDDVQRSVRRALEENLVESLEHRLGQIEELLDRIRENRDWDLLAETFDPAVCGLFAPPTVPEVQDLIAVLRSLPPSHPAERADPQTRFDEFQSLLKTLDYEAAYLLVDGVDAYAEAQRDPAAAVETLQPLLGRTLEWAEMGIYVKYFLPLELRESLQERAPFLLTNCDFAAIIKWVPDALREVISRRIQAAAGEYRAVTSLDALCTPALRRAEDELLRVARPFPRDLVMLVEQMFVEHVRRVGSHDRLEPEDLDAAIRWYQRLETTGSS